MLGTLGRAVRNPKRRSASRRPARPGCEGLEARGLLAAGLNSFAAIPIGAPAGPTGTTAVAFQVTPGAFTASRTKSVWLRIDDAGADGSAGPPLGAVTGTMVTRRGTVNRGEPTFRLPNNQELVRVGFGRYTLEVGPVAPGASAGSVNFALAGDATGAYGVGAGSLAAIRADLGKRAGMAGYNPAADVNGNGVVNAEDLRLARGNLGATTTVRPLGLSVTTVTTPTGPLLDERTVVVQTGAGAAVSAAAVETAAVAATADASGSASFQAAALWKADDGSENLSAFEVEVKATDAFGQSVLGAFPVRSALAEGLGEIVAKEPPYNPANAPPASESAGALPESVDLTTTGFAPTPYNQGATNSCVANAAAWDFWYVEKKEGLANPVAPSRAFVYYNSRVSEGTSPSALTDDGTWVGAMLQTMSTVGVAPESAWPYASTSVNAAPPATAYAAAQTHKILTDYQLDPTNLAQIEGSLAAGYPVVFAVKTTAGLTSESADATGFVPTPTAGDPITGGHAMVLVGYNNATQQFEFVNSWGTDWGAANSQGTRGYGTMPFSYVTSAAYASGFYSIRSVS